MKHRIEGVLNSDSDVFQGVLEFQEFYGHVDDFNAAILAWNEAMNEPDVPLSVRIQVQLAIIRVRRLRFSIEPAVALRELDTMANQTARSGVLDLQLRIVRAEIVLLKCGQHLEAKEELEAIASDLREADYHFLYGLVTNALSMCYMILADESKAEEHFEICLGVFRRYENKLQYAYCLNNYALLKKKTCLRKFAIKPGICASSARDTATSASWKVMQRP